MQGRMQRAAALLLAFAGSAGAVTMYQRNIVKYNGARYTLYRVDQVGNVGDPVSGGGHWEGNKSVTDTFMLRAGCYQLATVTETGNTDYNMTLVETGDTLYPGDELEFSVGGAFCDLNERDYGDCFDGRSRNKPAMTCRNADTVLLGECGYKEGDAEYTDIADQCQGTPLFPITLTLVVRPNLNASDPTFESRLAAELGKLLDIYPDAITGVTVTHHDGFDVVDIQISAYLQDELQAILAILQTDGALDSLTTSVPALVGTEILDVGVVEGANADIPSDVQDTIDALDNGTYDDDTDNGGNGGNGKDDDAEDDDVSGGDDDAPLECDDGSAPNAKGKCEDGSTPHRASSGKGSSGLSDGAIAGIAIGAIIGSAVLLGAGSAMLKKHRAKKAAAAKAQPPVVTAAPQV